MSLGFEVFTELFNGLTCQSGQILDTALVFLSRLTFFTLPLKSCDMLPAMDKEMSMKKIIFTLALLTSFGVQAFEGEVVLKTMQCKGATLEMIVTVVKDTYPGSVPTVGWIVEDTTTGKRAQYMGYLFSENGLKEFRSTDIDSSVEVSGSLSVLKWADKEEALFCK